MFMKAAGHCTCLCFSCQESPSEPSVRQWAEMSTVLCTVQQIQCVSGTFLDTGDVKMLSFCSVFLKFLVIFSGERNNIIADTA